MKYLFLLFALSITSLLNSQTMIIAPQYSDSRGFSEGLAAVKTEGRWGYIDIKGETIIPPIYEKARDFHDGLAAVKIDKEWGFINKRNEIVIPPAFIDAHDFSEGFAAVRKGSIFDNIKDGYEAEESPDNENGLWLYIDMEGKQTFNKTFHKVSDFHNGLAAVRVESSWKYIDKDGNVISNNSYRTYQSYKYSDNLLPAVGGEFHEYGYVNIDGEWKISPQFTSVTEFCDGYAIVEDEVGNSHIINNIGQKLYTGKNLCMLGNGYFVDNNHFIMRIDELNHNYFVLKDNIALQCIKSNRFPESANMCVGSYLYNKNKSVKEPTDIINSHNWGITYVGKPYMGLWSAAFTFDAVIGNGPVEGYGFIVLNMSDFVYQYVESQMKDWLRRDEFESTSTYESRTSEANRQQKMVYYADDLINNWLKKGLDQWTLSDYDADTESFELTTDLGKYNIRIPTSSARILKSNWSSAKKQVGFKYDNGLSLAKIDFTISLGNNNVTLSVNTATGTIKEDNHDNINIELPSIKWLEFVATATSKECPIKLGINSKSKIESVTITVNGVQDRGIKTVYNSDYDLTINRTLTLNEGPNVIKVSVRNAAGTTQEEKTIVYRPQGGELPSIEWLDFAATANKKEYQMKLGIKSKSKVEEVNVTVNGALTRGIKTVASDGYDLTVDRTLSLIEGINRIVVSVRNGDGISTSEKVITYQGNNPTPVLNDKRIALVIGNSHYSNSEMNLANPENDAKDVAEKLKGLGFEVVLQLDATKENMERELSSFGEKAKDYDVAMFYYAGHGIQSKGVNYLIPTNIDNLAENNLKWKCVNIEQVLDVMEDSQCKLKIVVLDACRNDPVSRKWHRSTATRGLSIMSSPIGTIIAYSTAPGMTAQDGKGRNSPYTEAFLNTLGQPNLDISNFFQEVMAQVTKNTHQSQNPWWSSSYTGNFYFNKQ